MRSTCAKAKPAIKIVVGADDAVPAGQVRYADTLPISRRTTRRSTSTRISTTRPPVCTLPAITNRPKGVPINNINEVLSAHDVMMHFPRSDRPHDEHDPVVPPRRHPPGGPCPTLYAGGEVVILRDFAPKRCLEYAAKYNISFLIGVPTIISRYARPPQERTPHDPVQLRGIVTMGAPFEKSACEKYMKLLTPNIFQRLRHDGILLEHISAPVRPAG